MLSGTSKASEPYKVGKKMTDILLEILNLNKTEVISIDIISNQEFTEVVLIQIWCLNIFLKLDYQQNKCSYDLFGTYIFV